MHLYYRSDASRPFSGPAPGRAHSGPRHGKTEQQGEAGHQGFPAYADTLSNRRLPGIVPARLDSPLLNYFHHFHAQKVCKLFDRAGLLRYPLKGP